MKKLDLDFSDITADKKPSQAPKAEVPKKKEAPKRVRDPRELLSGIMLPIPSLGEAKDLALCTAEEFSEWVASVWPCMDIPPQEIKGPGVKIELFKRIVNFNRMLRLSEKPKDPPIC